MAELEQQLADFLQQRGLPKDSTVTVRRIGSDDAMVDLILGVIRSGEKSMTFSVPWLLAADGESDPTPGQLICALDAQGSPAVLMRLTQVEAKRFGDINEQDLSREGIPMRSPEAWRPLHIMVWNEKLKPLGHEVTDDMPVWAEYFEVVEPVG